MATKFNFDANTTTLTYTFAGRMDGISTKEAEKTIHEGLANASEELSNSGANESKFKVIFDLKEVDFVASAFIRVCLFVAKKVEQPNFSIINTTPHINKTFKVSGLDSQLNVS